MKERHCPKCLVSMTDDNADRKTSGRQTGQFNSYCITCYIASHAEYARNRQTTYLERIALIKAERPCYDCGGQFPPEAMDFDHVQGKKSFTLARGQQYGWDLVREEIDKCQLVCANCHRVRTKKRAYEKHEKLRDP